MCHIADGGGELNGQFSVGHGCQRSFQVARWCFNNVNQIVLLSPPTASTTASTTACATASATTARASLFILVHVADTVSPSMVFTDGTHEMNVGGGHLKRWVSTNLNIAGTTISIRIPLVRTATLMDALTRLEIVVSAVAFNLDCNMDRKSFVISVPG